MSSRRCSTCKNEMDRDDEEGRCKRCVASEAKTSYVDRPTKKQKTGVASLTAVAAPAPASSATDSTALLAAIEDLKRKIAEQDEEQGKLKKVLAKQKENVKKELVKQKENVKKELAKQDEEQENLKKEQIRLKEDVAKQKEEIGSLRVSPSHKGVTAQAQFRHYLMEKYLLRSIENGKVWAHSSKWPLKEAATAPEDGTKEAGEGGVQAFVTNVLAKLKEHNDQQSEKWVSEPDPHAFRKASFRTRKPDIVNYKKGMTGSLAITSFGDIKKRGSGDFSSDEVGHVLDMAQSFMEHVGMHRPFLIVFLTDGQRWQFFRVIRDVAKNGGYEYQQQETVINDPKVGWKHYVALLTTNLPDLGYVEPAMNGVALISPLGRGGSAVVYRGIYEEKDVLVKVFFAKMKSSLHAETSALSVMHGVTGVPKVVACLPLTNQIKGVCSRAIVSTPVGIVFAPREGGASVNGKHLKELVEIVFKAHAKNLLHRDIKPDNIYLSNNSMLLNDWSSAVMASEVNAAWEGTLGFSVSQNEDPNGILNGKVRDLLSIVRTVYSLLFQEMPPSEEAAAIKYWEERIRQGTYWETAVQHAINLNYEGLGNLLGQMK